MSNNFRALQIEVYWGSFRQVVVEKKLFMEAYVRKYDYVHLISSVDIPLMDVEYFKSFFKKEVYIGFSNDKDIEGRVKYYYFFLNLIKGNSSKFLVQKFNLISVFFQKVIGINRMRNKKIKIRKGTNWVSLKKSSLVELVNFDISIFRNTFLADEFYVQTVLSRFENFDDEYISSSRYIDWNRGKPYVFGHRDIAELKNVVNTKYAFARKIENANIVK